MECCKQQITCGIQSPQQEQQKEKDSNKRQLKQIKENLYEIK